MASVAGLKNSFFAEINKVKNREYLEKLRLKSMMSHMTGCQGVADLDPMTVRRPQTKLAHFPRLVFDFGKHLGSFGFEMMVVAIGVSDSQVRKVAVTTQFAGAHVVRALAQHDHTAILRHEYPAGRLAHNAETEHLNVKLGRPTRVVNRKDVVIL